MVMSAWKRPWCAQIDRSRLGDRVEVVGWVRRRRDLGGLVFVDLRDRSGLLQLVFEDEMVDSGQSLSSQDVIRVVGTVRERAEGQANPELASGAVEVTVTELEVLGESDKARAAWVRVRDLAQQAGKPDLMQEAERALGRL